MKLTRNRFYLITLILLLLPIWGQWKLIIRGQTTTGTVVAQEEEITIFHASSYYSIIEFNHKEGVHKFRGPENIKYPLGTQLPIRYDKNNPHHCILLNVQGILLSPRSVWTVFLLIFWVAFYLSFWKYTPNKLKKNDKCDDITKIK